MITLPYLAQTPQDFFKSKNKFLLFATENIKYTGNKKLLTFYLIRYEVPHNIVSIVDIQSPSGELVVDTNSVVLNY